jgi:hypothetical protein
MDFFPTLMVGTPTIKNTCCSKDKRKEVAQLMLIEKQMIKSATPVKQNQGTNVWPKKFLFIICWSKDQHWKDPYSKNEFFNLR